MKSLKESWLDTTTAHRKMLFTIFAGIVQFERDLTSERTKEGIQAARKRGKHPGRPKTDEEKVNYALYLLEQLMNRTDAAEKADISRMTLYRKIQNNNETKLGTRWQEVFVQCLHCLWLQERWYWA